MQGILSRNPSLRASLLLLPGAAWLILFFLIPPGIALIYGFLERGTYGGIVWNITTVNFSQVFDSLYFGTFSLSIYIAASTTLLCLIFGYLLTYFIATRRLRHRNTLLLGLMIPYWTNFLIRTYVWLTILRTNTGLARRI